MTYQEFLETLALTRNKWEWRVSPNGRLRCHADQGREMCPLTAVASFAGLGDYSITEPVLAAYSLHLTDGADIVIAADHQTLGPFLTDTRADLLRAVGLA